MQTKKMGLLSATFLGISSIIGSGWLFAPYNAAKVAGPAAMFSWLIGAGIVLLLALCFAEIAALYPKRGLSAIIPTLSHNKYFGFPFAVANWLGVIAVIGLEAVGTIQYLINLFPHLTSIFYQHQQLTNSGVALASALIVIFCLLNYWGTQLLTKTNNILSIIKIIIPVMTGLIIIGWSLHPNQFTLYHNQISCYGCGAIFTAILSSGIIVAFNGFQTVISFSSEIKKPGKTIPLAVIIAIAGSLGIYLILQVAFIGGLPANMIVHGWKSLQLNAPMVQLVGFLGMGMLTTIIYFGSTVSPTGSAIVFMGASTRMLTAMARNQQMPKYFNHVNPQFSVSRRSLFANTIIAILFTVMFRSWHNLAEILSLFHIISYFPIPIALIVFRNMMRNHYRSFILPFGNTIACVVFIFFTYLFSLAHFSSVLEIMIAFLILHILFITINLSQAQSILTAMRQSFMMFVYFFYLTVLTYISPTNHQWLTDIPFSLVTITSASLFFYFLTRTEKNNREVIEASVRIYQAKKEDGV